MNDSFEMVSLEDLGDLNRYSHGLTVNMSNDSVVAEHNYTE
jgi:hypothetical protein